MLIDWFTVVAQAINFLILVWLLKRFLYSPILRAIDEREKRIAGQIQQAESKMAEAQRKQEEYQQKNMELEQQRADRILQAQQQAAEQRQRLIEEARAAAEALRQKLHESLRDDEQNLNRTLLRQIQEEVFAVARKTLADLADTTIEQNIARVFLNRLQKLDAPTRQTLADDDSPFFVRSAFELPPQQRAALETALRETFGSGRTVKFETAPELIAGIELSSDGQKLAWSIADYLDSMQIAVAEALNAPGVATASSQKRDNGNVHE